MYTHITLPHWLVNCEHNVLADKAIAEMQARVTLRIKQVDLVCE
jgi:hypothetical protein